jgi:hypothetical protein
MPFRPPGDCPVCGEPVAAGKRACPECGADERSGWSDDLEATELGLPSDEPFDSEGFRRREFGQSPGSGPGGLPKLWVWVAAVVGLALILAWIILPLGNALRN